LDKERLDFIKERWFKEAKPIEKEAAIGRKVSKDIQMPKVPDKVKYKTRVMKFSVGTIKNKTTS